MNYFFEFHLTNPLNFWSPSFVHNLYIFVLIVLTNLLFILATWLLINYLRRFYGERPIPKEWKIFWWSFIFYALHEILEMNVIYQWFYGSLFNFLFFLIEIVAVVLLTWGCYLLVKTYVLKQ